MERTIRRGDIFMADLSPIIGSEQGGIRPVLILSNNLGNTHGPTVIAAPITSRRHKKAGLPTHAQIPVLGDLTTDSVVLLEQIRVLDKQRLQARLGRRRIPIFRKSIKPSLSVSGYGINAENME